MAKKTLLSVILSLSILLTGTVRPFYGHASIVADTPTYDDEITDDVVDETEDAAAYEEDTGDNADEGAQEAAPSDSVESKYKDQIDDISDKITELQKEEEQIKENIAGAKSEREKAEAEKAVIDRQMNLTKEQIALLYERIDFLEQDIEDKLLGISKKQEDIELKQSEINENFEILRKRLRAMYMQNTTTTLGLIVGSDSFSDFLTRTEYIRRIADHDRSLMETLSAQRADMEKEKKQLEDEKALLEHTKASIEADRRETEQKEQQLSVQQEKAQLQIQDLKSMENDYLADLDKNKKIQDAAIAELDRIYKEIEWSKNAYSGGAMAWPLPGFSSITSEYGLRFGGTNNHTGIDISGSGVFGHAIVAANDGVVAKTNFSHTPGVGYGIYVILDHGVDENGNSISTLYAHCSGISVSQGQQVKRGQAIAQVGSTGWSTGPHLHFEVRINGNHVNPRPYIFN